MSTYLRNITSINIKMLSGEDTVQFVRNNAWSIGLSLAAGYLVYKLIRRTRNLPPGPVGLPLLGVLHKIENPNKIHLDFHRMGLKYGDVFSCYLGRQLNIVLTNYDVIKEAFLTRGDDFSDRIVSITGVQFADFSDAIFVAPFNSLWKENKKFAVQSLKNTGFGTPKSEEKLLNEISVLVRYLENQKGSAFDPAAPLVNTTANALISILLDQRFPWDSDELKMMIKNIKDFLDALGETFTLGFIYQYVPLFLMKIFFAGKMKQCRSKADGLKSFIRKEIEMHKAEVDTANAKDFIDSYIKAGKDKTMSSDLLVNTICAFFPDGVTTAADAINWAILYLAYNPEDQKRAQKQIDEICGSRNPTLADRKELRFIEAIVTESLRLGNPASMTAPHAPVKDTTFRGYNIPRDGNTVISANTHSCHMNPRDFPEPEKFNPSRFIGKDGKLVNTERVIPFGIGTRMCMGSQYTRSIFFLTISHILQRFTLQFPADQPNPSLESDDFFIQKPQPYKVCAVLR